MTNPVPGYPISTPYGRRGPYWSCSEDKNGNGIHTGADYAAPAGTPVVAARAGTVVHTHHGDAFGSHQLEIRPGDGTRDFYAHMSARLEDGAWVEAGDRIGTVGSEGNITGPHLHFERHKVDHGGWSCSIITDPAPSLSSAATTTPGDPMPKCVNGYTDELMLTGDWQNVNWSTVDGHDEGVIAPGNPGFKFTGPYISTFMAHIKTSNHGVLWTRPVEGKVLDDGTWKPTQELLSQSVALDILGTNGIVDTRGQNLPADNRLRFQIRGPAGLVTGRLHVAVLYWP